MFDSLKAKVIALLAAGVPATGCVSPELSRSRSDFGTPGGTPEGVDPEGMDSLHSESFAGSRASVDRDSYILFNNKDGLDLFKIAALRVAGKEAEDCANYFRAIKALNPGVDPLKPGGELLRLPRFPGEADFLLDLRAEGPQPVNSAQATPDKPAVMVKPVQLSEAAREGRFLGYFVEAGDTLVGIARRELGEPSRWREIEVINKHFRPDFDPNKMEIGDLIYLPDERRKVEYVAPVVVQLVDSDSTETAHNSRVNAAQVIDSPITLQSSSECIRLLKLIENEQFGGEPILKAYDDGVGVWTIGWGHTGGMSGSSVREGQRISRSEAEELLRRDLAATEDMVRRAVKVPMTQNQFDACVLWCFNLGDPVARGASWVAKLNAGDYDGAIESMGRYNKATDRSSGEKKVLRGLERRRETERRVWSGAGYSHY